MAKQPGIFNANNFHVTNILAFGARNRNHYFQMYEDWTVWTPGINGANFSNSMAQYTIIGDQVFLNLNLDYIDTIGNNGVITITGLPIAPTTNTPKLPMQVNNVTDGNIFGMYLASFDRENKTINLTRTENFAINQNDQLRIFTQLIYTIDH